MKIPQHHNFESMQWNLDEIIPDSSESNIKKIYSMLLKKLQSISTDLRTLTQTSEISIRDIVMILETFDAFYIESGDFLTFAYLSFSADSIDPKNQTLAALALNLQTEIQKSMLEFQEKINIYISTHLEILSDPKLKKYFHILEIEQQKQLHKLDFDTEKILLEKNKSGISTLLQLRSQYLNKQILFIEKDGEIQKIPFSQGWDLLFSPEPHIRKKVLKAMGDVVFKDADLYATVLRSLVSDCVYMSQLRGFNSVIENSFLINDVTSVPVYALMQTMQETTHYYQKYLKLKAKYLGVSVLNGADLFAVPNIGATHTYSWKETREIITNAYYAVDDEMGDIVNDMFGRNRIDAISREGKTNDIFCHLWPKDRSAFIIMSFEGRFNNLYTLAHELGHAINFSLSSHEHGYLAGNPTPILTETAAKFGELIFIEYMLKHAKNNNERIFILSQTLDFNGYSLYWGTLRYIFEQSIYNTVSRGDILTLEKICKLYLDARKTIYGDALDDPLSMQWEWIWTPHYYSLDLQFYNYPYIFALNTAYKIKKQMESYRATTINTFKRMMRSGRTIATLDAGKELGLDFSNPNFWAESILQYKYYLYEFEKLVH